MCFMYLIMLQLIALSVRFCCIAWSASINRFCSVISFRDLSDSTFRLQSRSVVYDNIAGYNSLPIAPLESFIDRILPHLYKCEIINNSLFSNNRLGFRKVIGIKILYVFPLICSPVNCSNSCIHQLATRVQ